MRSGAAARAESEVDGQPKLDSGESHPTNPFLSFAPFIQYLTTLSGVFLPAIRIIQS